MASAARRRVSRPTGSISASSSRSKFAAGFAGRPDLPVPSWWSACEGGPRLECPPSLCVRCAFYRVCELGRRQTRRAVTERDVPQSDRRRALYSVRLLALREYRCRSGDDALRAALLAVSLVLAVVPIGTSSRRQGPRQLCEAASQCRSQPRGSRRRASDSSSLCRSCSCGCPFPWLQPVMHGRRCGWFLCGLLRGLRCLAIESPRD